jgi:small subunit ribosomal protein S5
MEQQKTNNNGSDKQTPTHPGRRTPIKGRGRGSRRGGKMFVKSEYKEKMIDLRRVARVVKGGKRFTFRATLVLGDEKGKVGIGVGKGMDVASAMDKARNQAKRDMLTILKKGTSIPHEVEAKYSAARVLIKPAPKGSGLRAGGAARSVLLLAGINDATSKCLGKTKNKLTNAMATMKALRQLKETK